MNPCDESCDECKRPLPGRVAKVTGSPTAPSDASSGPNNYLHCERPVMS